MSAGSQRRVRWGLKLTLVGVATVVGVKVVTMLVLAVATVGSYAGEDYAQARTFAEFLLIGNVVETHTAHFNVGTARAAAGDLLGARHELRTALALTGKDAECPIRLNLSLVLEALATQQGEAGKTAADVDYLDEARSVLSEAPETCRAGPLANLDARLSDAAVPPPEAPVESGSPAEAVRTIGIPVPADAAAALSEIDERMTAGQGRKDDEQEPTGDGRAAPVDKPW